MIEKWLINHKEKGLNDFGLKIRIFDISKIKIFEKLFLLETVHVTLKYHLLKYSNASVPYGKRQVPFRLRSSDFRFLGLIRIIIYSNINKTYHERMPRGALEIFSFLFIAYIYLLIVYTILDK